MYLSNYCWQLYGLPIGMNKIFKKRIFFINFNAIVHNTFLSLYNHRFYFLSKKTMILKHLLLLKLC